MCIPRLKMNGPIILKHRFTCCLVVKKPKGRSKKSDKFIESAAKL